MSGSAHQESAHEEGAHEELVVLVDDEGNATGTHAKATVHHASTPLHLAFSCYVFDADGRVLVTQRALAKVTWPGVWTNSVCGHPAPGEALPDAVRRRGAQELGLELTDPELVLPGFRYRAMMADGTVENELCPVYVARALGVPSPDPTEVESAEWVPWPVFRDAVTGGTREVSPWCRSQVAELAAAESEDGWFHPRAADLLPPAAR